MVPPPRRSVLLVAALALAAWPLPAPALVAAATGVGRGRALAANAAASSTLRGGRRQAPEDAAPPPPAPGAGAADAAAAFVPSVAGGAFAAAAGVAGPGAAVPSAPDGGLQLQPPSPLDAFRAAAAALSWTPLLNKAGDPLLEPVLAAAGLAPLVPTELADRAAKYAWEHLKEGFTCDCPACPACPGAPSPGPALMVAGVVEEAPTTTTTTPSPFDGPRLGPPKPPACADPPRPLEEADVRMTLFPMKPRDAIFNSSVPTTGNGIMWKLKDGGWAFQYPDMSANVDARGHTEIAWATARYSVTMDEDGISYHSMDTVVHRDKNGGLVYDSPYGTMHQNGDAIIYHWCHPNVVVYQTAYGLVYYDDLGMTYRGIHDVVHWARNGEVLYQGVGGLTRQRPDGSVTYWTQAGALFRHADGSASFTAEGHSRPEQVSPEALGPDQFPGPPLTAQEVLDMVNHALAMAAAVPAPAPTPAVAAPIS